MMKQIFFSRISFIPRISLDGSAIWPNEEFLKVPGDVRPLDRPPDEELGVCHETLGVVRRGRKLPLQQAEQRVLVLPVRLHLIEEFPLELKTAARSDVLESVANFLRSSRILLVPKLGEILLKTRL